ncbi:MAG: MoaD/ThiS family protein [Nitrososphaerota archaeon]|nr:MoaD/ThiS family protein [Nitrososphaerota archaeon]MDG6968500.1 MoaD/ThiS family protein [Nitrososphaerota archaeon]MDG6973372.1 MoaD/ThiS family protein [Nitrososphaerota archaeon]MDG6975432.1 MoaD/ThiS family protein [Nitrososphaerota archaeon]MDG7027169.1 MoaD/ThiS family protein [Nitrososphaerota archaeon]
MKVRYFALARELASAESEAVTVPERSSVRDLARMLEEAHPALSSLRGSLKFSVNFDVAEPGTALNEGDEVGVLPPVAGG